MAWKDNLQPASFKGVPFYVKAVEMQVGRNVELQAVYKPGSITPSVIVKDSGRLADRYIFDAFVIQNEGNLYDYTQDRDALIQAIKSGNEGMLIHPTIGVVEAHVVDPATIVESFTDEGGKATFTLDFVEFLPPGFGSFFENILDSVRATINTVRRAITHNPVSLTIKAIDQTILDVKFTVNTLKGAILAVRGTISSTVSDSLGILADIISIADTIAAEPCKTADIFLNAADSFNILVGFGENTYARGVIGRCSGDLVGVSGLPVKNGRVTGAPRAGQQTQSPTGYGASPLVSFPRWGGIDSPVVLSGVAIPEDLTASVVISIAETIENFTAASFDSTSNPEVIVNRLQIVNMNASALITTAAQIATVGTISSEESLAEIQGALFSAIDTVLERVSEQEFGSQWQHIGGVYRPIENNQIFSAMQTMKQALVQLFAEKTKRLLKKTDYKVAPGVISALMLAYDKYGNLNRHREIAELNEGKVTHPGFLPQGATLTILPD